VTLYPLRPTPEFVEWGNLPFFINLPIKVTVQFWTLWQNLMYNTEPAQWIILQVSLL
jgi:beta-1,4-mannosyltransferase